MAGTPSRDRIVDRVRALLAKADSTEHQAERDAFFAKAQALITRHHIDEAELEAADSEVVRETVLIVDWGHATRGVVYLYGEVAELNRCSLGHQLTRGAARIELFGTSLDIELTLTLVDYLLPQLRAALLRDRPRSRMSYSMGWVREVAARLAEAQKAEAAISNALVPTNVTADEALHAAFQVRSARSTEVDTRAYGSGMAAGENADIGHVKLDS